MTDSRRKGKAAELEVCKILRDTGAFPDAERDLEQARGADNGRDIVATDPWCLQVKRRANMDRATALRGLAEASHSATESAPYAACIHRSDRAKWHVTCDLADLAWYFTNTAWCGRTVPVEMTLEDWCAVVREVQQSEQITGGTNG
jgi:hypothetical protein